MFFEGEMIEPPKRKKRAIEVTLKLNELSYVTCVFWGHTKEYTNELKIGDIIRVAGKVHRDKLRVKLVER